MSVAKLLAAAELRRQVVEIDGEQITIREPSAFEYTQYQNKLEEDKTAAVAYLIQKCVLGEADAPLFSAEEALTVAGGSLRVGAVLATSIHQLIYGKGEAKNA